MTAYALIDEIDLAGISTGTFTSIPQTYRHLAVSFWGLGSVTTTQNFNVAFNTGASSHDYISWGAFTDALNVTSNTNRPSVFSRAGIDTVREAWGNFRIFDYTTTTNWKTIVGTVGSYQEMDYMNLSGTYKETGAVTQLSFYSGSSNFASGVLRLYGIS